MRLTMIDKSVWRYLWERFEAGTGAPSFEDLCRGGYCSRSGLMNSLAKLEAAGAVTWAYLPNGRRAARGCLTVKPPSWMEAADAAQRVSEAAERAAREQAKTEAAAEKLNAQRLASKLRMRRLRAQRKLDVR